ncbi:MAG: Lrp/AsnC family transcriptional regulator [Candidatus Woesearchaeota archaeon]
MLWGINMKTKDKLVISHFRNNSRMSLTKISRETKIPVSTLFDKLKELENKCYIRKHTTLLDFKKLGFDLRCFYIIKVDSANKLKLQDFLSKSDKINNLFRISNGNDFLIEVIFNNISEMDIYNRELEKFGIVSKKEFFVMEDLKREAFMSYVPNLGILGVK